MLTNLLYRARTHAATATEALHTLAAASHTYQPSKAEQRVAALLTTLALATSPARAQLGGGGAAAALEGVQETVVGIVQ
ncbi:hypothetical protein LJ737_23055, partial [Hymenobacter sp. 15J16-1T3B]|uniref:hypothetical protein n=1 Tax=Hymenobacter sp. 15J16-1T3B TaxID=2886941 RepID=UPI001D110764